MNIETAENVVLERLVPDLKSQGYDVFVHPDRQMVPPFLGAYLPDVIALRDDKNLVIEIKQGSNRAEKTLQELAKRFEGHDGSFVLSGLALTKSVRNWRFKAVKRYRTASRKFVSC
jgi:Holliday junction resolvase